MARRKALVTFEGWDGKWWRRIKVGRAVYSAVSFVYVPMKASIALGVVEGVTGWSLEDTLFGPVRKDRKAGRRGD